MIPSSFSVTFHPHVFIPIFFLFLFGGGGRLPDIHPLNIYIKKNNKRIHPVVRSSGSGSGGGGGGEGGALIRFIRHAATRETCYFPQIVFYDLMYPVIAALFISFHYNEMLLGLISFRSVKRTWSSYGKPRRMASNLPKMNSVERRLLIQFRPCPMP